MKIKNLWVTPILGFTLFSSFVLAQTTPNTQQSFSYMKFSDTGIYAEGLVGYNRYALKEIYGDSFIPSGVRSVSESLGWRDGTGNWTFGLAIGYQFHRNAAAEAGGIYTLNAKYTYRLYGVFPAEDFPFKFKPWYAYLAGKLIMPLWNNFSVFTKLGAGFQKLRVTSQNANMTLGNQRKWGPMFGAGIAYNFATGFYINAQWLRFTGEVKNGTVTTIAPNIFLAGFGYKFAM